MKAERRDEGGLWDADRPLDEEEVRHWCMVRVTVYEEVVKLHEKHILDVRYLFHGQSEASEVDNCIFSGKSNESQFIV